VAGKGLEELVAAFARLAAEDPGVRLKIAGDGPGRPELETALERHDVGGRVELAGVVTDMPSYWRDADVAVMPSTASESFGMVALEAMACGRPVVATRNGGANDLVDDGVTGRLVGCGDVRALEAAMRDYASDPRLRRAHGRAGRERCEAQFTIDRCATRYARLLREAARERRSAASGQRTSTPRDLKRVSRHAE
jgi:glycosyltransferase involved in cell wall biosynthesis